MTTPDERNPHDFVVEDESHVYDIDARCRICGEYRMHYLHR